MEARGSAQCMLQAFEKSIAAVAEREQAVAGLGEQSGCLEGREGPFEGGRGDEAHGAG
jgi:hypothetical protein